MQLMFQLSISGHTGIPDGEWESAGYMASDTEEAIETKAFELLKEKYKKYVKGQGLEELVAKMTIRREFDWLVVTPGFYSDTQNIDFKVKPVLKIGERYFELKEVE